MQQVEEFQCEMEKNKAPIITTNKNLWSKDIMPDDQQ